MREEGLGGQMVCIGTVGHRLFERPSLVLHSKLGFILLTFISLAVLGLNYRLANFSCRMWNPGSLDQGWNPGPLPWGVES